MSLRFEVLSGKRRRKGLNRSLILRLWLVVRLLFVVRVTGDDGAHINGFLFGM